MSFDGNNPPSDHGEDPGLFDPAPLPSGDGALRIQRIITDNAAWLQAEPRTSLSIIFHLFSGMVRTMSDAADAAVMVGAYLWDAGYVPRDTETCNPTWHLQHPVVAA